MNRAGSMPEGHGIRPSIDGADPAALLEWFAHETRDRYVRTAWRWSRRHKLDENGLSPEGAVHRTWVVMCQQIQAGHLPTGLTSDALARLFHVMLLHVLADEWRRQHAHKRTLEGERRDKEGTHESSMQRTGDLVDEVIESRGERPEERVMAEDEAAYLLGLLDLEHPKLRELAIGKMDGLSNEEIASKLAVSLSTVERMLRRIRAILAPHVERQA